MRFYEKDKIIFTRNTIKLKGNILGISGEFKQSFIQNNSGKIIPSFKDTSGNANIGITQSNIFNNFLKKDNKYIIYNRRDLSLSFIYPDLNIGTNNINHLLDFSSITPNQELYNNYPNEELIINYHLLYNVTSSINDFKEFNLYNLYTNLYQDNSELSGGRLYFVDGPAQAQLPDDTSLNYYLTNNNLSDSILLYRNENDLNNFSDAISDDTLIKGNNIDVSNTIYIRFIQSNYSISISYGIYNLYDNPYYHNPIDNGEINFLFFSGIPTVIDNINFDMLENTTRTFNLRNNSIINSEAQNFSLPFQYIRKYPSNGSMSFNFENQLLTYTPRKGVNITNPCIAKKNPEAYKNFIGKDNIIIEIWYNVRSSRYSNQDNITKHIINVTINVNCDNKKCWPKALYNPIQHISEIGSARSHKMQTADKIKHASKHRGRCQKKYIANPSASVIPPAIINNYSVRSVASNSKKREVFAFF